MQTEQRIIELEIKVAYQEDLLQALNQIIIQQQDQLDRLSASQKQLNHHLQNLMLRLDNDENVDQTPPHY